MTIEDLMKTRYKVIAPWPEMGRWIVKVGDIFTEGVNYETTRNQDGDAVPTFEWETFPHLFKKLEWWEERKPEEMPDYVKRNEGGRVYKISDAETKWDFGFTIAYPMTEHDVLYSECLPATEQEYNEYQKSKTP